MLEIPPYSFFKLIYIPPPTTLVWIGHSTRWPYALPLSSSPLGIYEYITIMYCAWLACGGLKSCLKRAGNGLVWQERVGVGKVIGPVRATDTIGGRMCELVCNEARPRKRRVGWDVNGLYRPTRR